MMHISSLDLQIGCFAGRRYLSLWLWIFILFERIIQKISISYIGAVRALNYIREWRGRYACIFMGMEIGEMLSMTNTPPVLV